MKAHRRRIGNNLIPRIVAWVAGAMAIAFGVWLAAGVQTPAAKTDRIVQMVREAATASWPEELRLHALEADIQTVYRGDGVYRCGAAVQDATGFPGGVFDAEVVDVGGELRIIWCRSKLMARYKSEHS